MVKSGHSNTCFSSGNSGLRNGNEQKILEMFRHVKLQKTGASHCMVHNCLTMNNENLVIACIFSFLIFKNVCLGDL